MEKLHKNIREIFADRYIIPLYQRNFTWREEQIVQLLQDIYTCACDENLHNCYYIGSLVVLRRHDTLFEVIDGQQRLTTLSLIVRLLWQADTSVLQYDSRPEVEEFLKKFYKTGKVDSAVSSKTANLVEAIEIIKNAKIKNNHGEDVSLFCNGRITVEGEAFKRYFAEKVILIRIEVPTDTDVASYFEIMNNRGEQLEKHEILKAMLMNNIKDEDNVTCKRKIFAMVWDACSQMDIHVQTSFRADIRRKIFGENYDSWCWTDDEFLNEIIDIIGIDSDSDCKTIHYSGYSIDRILGSDVDCGKVTVEEDDSDEESEYKSIIDFPNFIMHVLKLQMEQASEIDVNSQVVLDGYTQLDDVIQLNDKYLLDNKDYIHGLKPMKFIRDLLFYRAVFDRYVVKAELREGQESDTSNENENFKWSLKRPHICIYDSNSRLYYKNTFDDKQSQERIVKALSMLQVSFRTRIYKTWLYEIFEWFKTDKDFNINISDAEYLSFLDKLIIKRFLENNDKMKRKIKSEDMLEDGYEMGGVAIPHFIFNFIDYLYWRACHDGLFDIQALACLDEYGISEFKFDFKYHNSVEHHYPQHIDTDLNDGGVSVKHLNSIGNLCLVNSRINSSMNRLSPLSKAEQYASDTPKRSIMYAMTKQKRRWGAEDIDRHKEDVMSLLENYNKILGQYIW